MAGVGQDRPVLHQGQVFFGEDVAIPGDGDENVAPGRRFPGGEQPEAVHERLESPHRVHFHHDHPGAQTIGPDRDALPAVSVAHHHHRGACHQQVRGANDAIQGGLAGPVVVVEKMLGGRIVDRHYGQSQRSLPCHGPKPGHAGGGLLGGAQGGEVGMGAVQRGNEVASIVHQ